MKTGIELIAKERQEQIEKHGYNIDHDMYQFNICPVSPLRQAAIAAIGEGLESRAWPDGWSEDRINHIKNKSYKDRLIIAGALLAAEIDRIEFIENRLWDVIPGDAF